MKILKKIYSALFDDLHWKLLALVAAGVIWFIGMHDSDPYRNLNVSPRLQLANMEIMAREGIVVLNEDALREINVSVMVRGLRSDIVYLEAADLAGRLADFVEVIVDFRAIEGAEVAAAGGVSTQTLRISPNLLHPGFDHISINPFEVDILLDTTQERNISVQTIQAGEASPGFELQSIRLNNETVRIRGARTDVQAVSRVEAIVDITGVHEEVEQIVEFVVLDAYGEDITDRVHLNIDETTATIRVWQVRTADIILHGEGTVAPGFAVAGISGDVESVEIVGSADALENFENIRVEIDLAGASANITQELQIADGLPDDIHLRQYETEIITATARIEPIEERAFTVPHGNIRTRGVGLFTLVDEATPIRVVVSGPRSLIEGLAVTEILPEFDLRGMEIGVHTVDLSVELPGEIRLVGEQPTLLVQIHEPAANDTDEDIFEDNEENNGANAEENNGENDGENNEDPRPQEDDIEEENEPESNENEYEPQAETGE